MFPTFVWKVYPRKDNQYQNLKDGDSSSCFDWIPSANDQPDDLGWFNWSIAFYTNFNFPSRFNQDNMPTSIKVEFDVIKGGTVCNYKYILPVSEVFFGNQFFYIWQSN